MEVQQLNTRDGGVQQGTLPPQEEGRSPLAEPEEASVCSPVILRALTEVTVFSLKITASQTQAAEAWLSPPISSSGRALWHRLSSPTWVFPPLRTQAEARSSAHRLRMHVTIRSLPLGSSQLNFER